MILILLFLLSGAYSCHYTKSDTIKAIHPLELDGRRFVYVQNNPDASGYSIYESGPGQLPVWCNIKPNYKDAVRSFNGSFRRTIKNNKKTELVCYSGDLYEQNIDLAQSTKLVSPAKSLVKKNMKGRIFIEEDFYPYQKIYIISLLVSIDPNCLMKEVFSLYRRFCLGSEVQSCISSYEDDFVVNIVINNVDHKELILFLTGLRAYVHNARFSPDDEDVLFGYFSSIMIDNCSKQRWFYDAFYSGINRPQRFMERSNWGSEYCGKGSMKIYDAGIKVLDIKKINPKQVNDLRSSLESFLK